MRGKPHNFQDLTGMKFGMLFVKSEAGKSADGKLKWNCVCDCGNECVAIGNKLKRKKKQSCGCAQLKLIIMATGKRMKEKAEEITRSRIIEAGTMILPGGFVCKFDPEDTDIVAKYVWHASKTKYGTTYVRAFSRTTRKRILMHNLIMGARWIDHKNRDGLDNRKANLRRASQSQNQMNRPKPRTSKNTYKGVVPPHGRTRKWQASITINGKQVRFGKFDNERDAAIAYDAKAKESYGEFAFLNFPEAA